MQTALRHFAIGLSAAHVVMWMCAAPSQGQSSTADVSLVREWFKAVPQAGAVEATYQAVDGAGMLVARYELSGATYAFVQGVGWSARLLGGQDAQSAPSGPPTFFVTPSAMDCMVEAEFPVVAIRDLLNRPETIRKVESLPEGGLRVVAVFAEGMRCVSTPEVAVGRSPVTVTYELGADHFVRRRSVSADASTSSAAVELEYSEDSKSGFGVVSRFGEGRGAFKLTHVEWFAKVPASFVDPKILDARAAALRFAIQEQLAGLSADDRPADEQARLRKVSDRAMPSGYDSDMVNWRNAIVLCGLIVLGVAGYGAFRRRSA